MPQEMEFLDIRQGSDLEFGQSIYEPFGIAQVEPLCYGALCVLSSACGCLGFIRRAGGLDQANVIVADYIALDDGQAASIESALAIGQDKRDQIEAARARQVAQTIAERLPRDDAAHQELIDSGFALSRRMSWEVVVTQYLLPGLERALGQATK
jgi:glycogen synthase